jgi:hypothetical protein
MATTATRQIEIVLSGDVVGTQTYDAIDNVLSPAVEQIATLAPGANTLTKPSDGISVVTAVTIRFPSTNTNLVTLKGVSGDTGIKLHPTDPLTISLDPTATGIVLTAADTVNGVRLLWT